MNRFEVGDRVRIRSDRRGYGWNSSGLMDKHMGKVMTVHAERHGSYVLEECRGENSGGDWLWAGEDLTLFPEQKVLITHDGTTTRARLFEGNKVVKSAEAKCAPGDTFDFSIGANLAYDRLMQRLAEAPHPEKPAAEPIKLYCVKDRRFTCTGEKALTKGKVYAIQNARIYLDDGESYPTTSWESFKRSNPDYAACLVPLAKRPAKVGEWVYITEGTAKGIIGEVLDVDSNGFPRVRHRDVWGVFADEHGMEHTRFTLSDYLVLDGYQPESEYYNGKVVCVGTSSLNDGFTIGKVYVFKNGFVLDDGGTLRPNNRSEPVSNLADVWAARRFIEYKGEAQ